MKSRKQRENGQAFLLVMIIIIMMKNAECELNPDTCAVKFSSNDKTVEKKEKKEKFLTTWNSIQLSYIYESNASLEIRY